MPPMSMPPMGAQGSDINLFTILINIVFGFVVGLIVFLGFQEVISYGSKLAEDALKLTGYGQQMAAFGFATTAVPYVVLTPIAGLVVKQLTAVRSIKGFAFFAAAVLVGVAISFFAQGYIHSLAVAS